MRMRRWGDYSVYGLVLLVALGLGVAGVSEGLDAWTDMPVTAAYRAFLFYESWLMLLLLPVVFYALRRRHISRLFGGVLIVLLALGLYARFIEPNLLLTRHTSIQTGYKLRVALISDLHYGQFSTIMQQERLVNRLNALEVDAVLVAGDWTYDPPKGVDLVGLLAPFARVKHPVYSVPGNHDEEQPGPPIQDALRSALLKNGIIPVEGRNIDLGPVHLVGLHELWSCMNGAGLPEGFHPGPEPVLLLGHHPEAADLLPALPAGSLLLAGHTHGGQIDLPFLTEWYLGASHLAVFRQGLYRRGNVQVFVTSGVGMIGLPLRFAVPPVIDVLELY